MTMHAHDATSDDSFIQLEHVLQSGGVDAAFNEVVDRFRRDKQYRRVFDARLMKKRMELNLPLVSQPTLDELPKDVQQAYQDAYVQAAREVGELGDVLLQVRDARAQAAGELLEPHEGVAEPLAATRQRQDAEGVGRDLARVDVARDARHREQLRLRRGAGVQEREAVIDARVDVEHEGKAGCHGPES